MALLIFVIVIIGALIAIASGIWVAFSLGRAISLDGKEETISEIEKQVKDT